LGWQPGVYFAADAGWSATARRGAWPEPDGAPIPSAVTIWSQALVVLH